jgi:hypothetical protein
MWDCVSVQFFVPAYGAISSVGVLLLATPRSVTVNGRLPAGNPSGNLTTM